MGSLKRKTSVVLNSESLDFARANKMNVSAIADAALEKAISDYKRSMWLRDNEKAYAAQAEWHERNGHPLADIIAATAGASWQN